MSLMLGTTAYSMTNEWLAGQYSLVELIDEIGRRGLGPGLEIIGFQSLRGFPDKVSRQEIGEIREAMERNELIPTSLASNADIAVRKDRLLTPDERVEYMRPQIELAAELGFPVSRIQSGLTPDVLEKLEPIARANKVKLGMEIHAPDGPCTEKTMKTREAYDRIGSEWLGFVPDFSACMRAIPPGMLAKLREHGLSEAGVETLVTAWETPGLPPFVRYGQFAEQCKDTGEPELPVGQARLIFTMFGRESIDGWAEILPQVVHIHGKFYDVEDDLTSPSIDYEGVMQVFRSLDRTVSMSSEWEGHAYLDVEDQDAFEMVSRHHKMCARFLGDDHVATSL